MVIQITLFDFISYVTCISFYLPICFVACCYLFFFPKLPRWITITQIRVFYDFILYVYIIPCFKYYPKDSRVLEIISRFKFKPIRKDLDGSRFLWYDHRARVAAGIRWRVFQSPFGRIREESIASTPRRALRGTLRNKGWKPRRWGGNEQQLQPPICLASREKKKKLAHGAREKFVGLHRGRLKGGGGRGRPTIENQPRTRQVPSGLKVRPIE